MPEQSDHLLVQLVDPVLEVAQVEGHLLVEVAWLLVLTRWWLGLRQLLVLRLVPWLVLAVVLRLAWQVGQLVAYRHLLLLQQSSLLALLRQSE